ncbi:hypothetical protein GH146_04810 [archaeon]|nr:hypothetical protein [archaeon]
MVPVKLPKEVLRLFPMWEHRCSGCGTYVESNMSFCPNCKTPFDEKRWRVPPRFLKSHDAMSEYAHKVLAPKLTPEQRELLFQYFTELFSDGFESGDFSEWSGTQGSPAVISADPHHGTSHGEFEAHGYGTETCYKDFGSSYSTISVRIYLQYETLPSGGVGALSIVLGNQTSGDSIAAGLIINESPNKWWIKDLANGPSAKASVTPQTGVYYCFELEFTVGSNVKLHVDDSTVIDWSSSFSSNQIDRVRVGYRDWGTTSGNVHIDCVVVADTYIGPETAEQTYTKTWTTDALFKKLGIPKTLGIDAAFQKQDTQKTFGLDVAFQKSFIIQKQIDAFFKRFDIVKSFAVDARFSALITQTVSRQIDVLLKKLDVTKSFGVDVYFGAVVAETYTKNFALDVVFAYKVRLPELWLDENGKIVLNISKPYTWVGT